MQSVQIFVTKNFQKEAKKLSKKYKSLKQELTELNSIITTNPKIGTPIGLHTFKIRIGVKSKGKGKRGGLRVISYKIYVNQNNISVYLISIFDKSDQTSISKGLLKHLIEQIDKELGYDD